MSKCQSITKEQALDKYGLSSLLGRKVAVAVEFYHGSIDVEIGVIIDPATIFDDGPETDMDLRVKDLWVEIDQGDSDLIHRITMPEEKFLLFDEVE